MVLLPPDSHLLTDGCTKEMTVCWMVLHVLNFYHVGDRRLGRPDWDFRLGCTVRSCRRGGRPQHLGRIQPVELGCIASCGGVSNKRMRRRTSVLKPFCWSEIHFRWRKYVWWRELLIWQKGQCNWEYCQVGNKHADMFKANLDICGRLVLSYSIMTFLALIWYRDLLRWFHEIQGGIFNG